MNKNDFKKIREIAEILNWEVEKYKEYIIFTAYTKTGQDVTLEIEASDIEKLVSELSSHCENFDISYETYLWLDDLGHGKNGAPYDMKDIYEDMEERLRRMEELKNGLEELIK